LLRPRKDSMRISAIVTTYNRSEHLRRCLASLEMQTRVPDEVVIADDGSDQEHVETIEEIMRGSPLNLVYARQEHRGHRACASRNNGVRHASGDYLIVADGDAVFLPEVVEEHLRASHPRRWVSGWGLWLTAEQSERVSKEFIRSGGLESLWAELPAALTEKRFDHAARFKTRALKAWLWPSEGRRRRLKLVSLHTSMYRSALERINGFDENFVGWGRSDKDLGLRLQLAGIRGRTIADRARVLHLYHELLPRPAADDANSSYNTEYYSRPRHRAYWCEKGLMSAPSSGFERLGGPRWIVRVTGRRIAGREGRTSGGS